MKRWSLYIALALPLPFAALPLVAITFSNAAPLPNDEPVALEVIAPVTDTVEDSDSLGLKIAPEPIDQVGCGDELSHES